MNTQQIAQSVNENKEKFISELVELLKIPSISADSTKADQMMLCAEMVKNALSSAGATEATVINTAGHPIVFASVGNNPNIPTVLVYGHYDVQPPDPLHLWVSPPFEPRIFEGKIFARGACDDKGQFFMHIKALEIMQDLGELPVNIKFLIEGEEEIGSPNLGKFITENKDLMQCDVVLISDSAMISLDTPSLDMGVRGLAYLEVELTGPNRDLHSGVYGGAVANPATILCKLIASLHNSNNQVAIPGFYDDVLETTEEERALLSKAPFDLAHFMGDLGIDAVWGENGYSTNERTGIRPTLEVNGIWGGYTGEGAKTVLPSKASAKISCRLVPNQSSKKIEQLVQSHLQSISPASVKVKVTLHHGGEPYLTPIDSIPFLAASEAIQTTLGKLPIPVRGGGSIPICALFEKNLGAKVVFLGFGLDSDNLHSPNEKFEIANFLKGIETIPHFHFHFASLIHKSQKG